MLQIRRDDKDRPNRIPWPPILLATALLVGGVLEVTLGSSRIWDAGPRWVGVAVLLAGLAVALAGIAHFRSIGTPTDPTARAAKLATSGIYRFTRNPMYLGMVLLTAGLGLAWPSLWVLACVPVLAFALLRLAILREEAFLGRRFGSEYETYRTRVRRWL